MKVISRFVMVALAGVLVAAAIPAAKAACPTGGFLITESAPPYISSPGTGNKTPSSIKGAFWILGQGAAFNNAGYSSASWIRNGAANDTTPPFYLNGDWGGDAAIAGCPQDATQPSHTVVLLSDQNAPGSSGFFAAGCVQGNALFQYDFSNASPPVGLALVAIPRPRITGSTRGAGQVCVTVATDPAVGGVYTDGTCGALTPTFKVYQQTVPKVGGVPGPTPSNRLRANGWTLLAGNGCVPCAADSDVYLASSVVIDAFGETQHVGTNSLPVECGQNVASRPADFKLIKKPARTKTPAR